MSYMHSKSPIPDEFDFAFAMNADEGGKETHADDRYRNTYDIDILAVARRSYAPLMKPCGFELAMSVWRRSRVRCICNFGLLVVK